MYSKNLALIHQAGFQQLIEGVSSELLALFKNRGLQDGLVIDLGCGSGYWLNRLVEAGYQAFGVDLSSAFVEMAQKNAPQATVLQGSVLDFAFPECIAITAVGEVLGYREDYNKHSLLDLFQRAYASLCPGGVLAFDLLVQDSQSPLNYRTWRSEDDWAVLVEVQEDILQGWLTRDIETFVRQNGSTYDRAYERHLLQVYDSETILANLNQVGFSSTVSTGYGTYFLPPRRNVFIAVKD